MWGEVIPNAQRSTTKEKVSFIVRLLHNNPSSYDLAIDSIKKCLNDPTLSGPDSIAVKTELISVLSSPVIGKYRINTSRLIKSRRHNKAIIRRYIDGTEDHIEFKNGAIIKSKPQSPWHQLTLEQFVRAYLTLVEAWVCCVC